jgi:dephospho-CoA kinase
MNITNRKVFKLGITGGIGSGKSTVCKIFNVLGIPVFSADIAASDLMENEQYIIAGINSIFNKNLYTEGKLNRTELSSLIFNNNQLLEKVNLLVHPAVTKSFLNWSLKQDSKYVIMEAAILFESGASKYVDKVLTITAPIEERIKRVTYRSNLTREQIQDRIKNQRDDEFRVKLSDYVISNSENDMIIPEILKIHENILEEIKNKN